MRTEYQYFVDVENDNNDEFVNIHKGDDMDAAKQAYKEYKFQDGDTRVQLSRCELIWRYEEQKTPDTDLPRLLEERYNY